MDEIEITFHEEPDLNNPILIEGLPGIGLVGKLAADHMLDELEGEKFAEITSKHLPPQVTIKEDNTVKLVNMEFYYHKGQDRDLILLLGGFQGVDSQSQYLLSDATLDLCEKYDVKKMYTLGGLGTGNITKDPKVFGAATNEDLVEELEEHGVVFRGSGAIFGASGLLLGLGKEREIEGACLMGETHGQIVDAKSAEAVIKILTEILDIEIDMTKLEEKAQETQEQMDKVSKMIEEQKKTYESQPGSGETDSYIR